MGEHRPNIAFAGLTAAGKTTHAKILAEQLDYEYVSATQVILDILEIKQEPDRIWFSQYDKIEQAREGDEVDIELERRVTELANKQDGLVLDTWALGYIYTGPLIRIWLESDESSRTRKCFVSQGEQGTLDLQGSNDLVNQKDSDTQQKFLRRLGFDLFTDMSRYDAIICNTELIPEPTIESSLAGINTFSPVVYDVARYLIDKAVNPSASIDARTVAERHGPYITQLNPVPWSYMEAI